MQLYSIFFLDRLIDLDTAFYCGDKDLTTETMYQK